MSEEITRQLLEGFNSLYGGSKSETAVFFAPGRVNLIGEHTDYNDGFVLPASISYGTWLAIRKANHGSILLSSLNFPGSVSVSAEGQIKKQKTEWANYPLGVVEYLLGPDFNKGGMEMLFSGNIPSGAGLSSSASIEMVTAYALRQLYNLDQSEVDLIKLARRVENDYVGMNCGIMDQFAVGMSKKENALFLDCRSLDYRFVPLQLGEYKIIIVNSKKTRGLTSSKYNERVEECQRAVKYISTFKKINSLRDAVPDDIERLKKLALEKRFYQRAKHVVSENERVINALSFLENGRIKELGELMVQSHISLRDDYEVTGPELDLLFESALEVKAVAGTRMTGAGFGGCTVSLVKKDSIEEFKQVVSEKYTTKTGIHPEFYVPNAGEDIRRVT